MFGIDTPGYASLLIAVLLMGAIQLVSIGIIGEYLGRLFLEVKGRPIYVVEGVYEEGVGEVAAGLMDLKEEDILGADIGRHWYYRSKAAALRRAGRGPQAAAPARCRRGLGLLLASSAEPKAARSRRSASISATTATATTSVGGKPVLYRRDCGADRLRPRADDGRAGACRRRPRPCTPLRRQGAVRRAFPGDGARLPLPVERPRRLPRAQAALPPAARSRRRCATPASRS